MQRVITIGALGDLGDDLSDDLGDLEEDVGLDDTSDDDSDDDDSSDTDDTGDDDSSDTDDTSDDDSEADASSDDAGSTFTNDLTSHLPQLPTSLATASSWTSPALTWKQVGLYAAVTLAAAALVTYLATD